MSAPRFMLDEHVWAGLIKVGERIGADVVSVQTLIPQGSSDEDVLALAAEAKRILLTSNARDFAPLAAEWFLVGWEHWGIISVLILIIPSVIQTPAASNPASCLTHPCTDHPTTRLYDYPTT